MEMNEENLNTPADTPEPDMAASSTDPKPVEDELTLLKAQLNESKDAFLRAKAEGENIRRRAIEDVAKAHKFALESFAEHLLPVLDSMHGALAHHSDDAKQLKEGLKLTLKQFTAALEKGKIVEIHPEVTAKFDPHLHQAIATVPSEQEANTIVSVLQKGYLIAERVLRPALVTVSQTK
jgi:molecular chaperone GrpE